MSADGSGVRLARVTPEPLDVAAHLAAVEDDRCGAIAVFVGRIRNHDSGVSGEVSRLDYSAHPDAERVLEEIAAGLGAPDQEHPYGPEASRGREHSDAPQGPVIVAVSHRVGTLGVGDVALVACVATPHRAHAQALAGLLVERIKAELPVWKKQHTVDGASHWVGL